MSAFTKICNKLKMSGRRVKQNTVPIVQYILVASVIPLVIACAYIYRDMINTGILIIILGFAKVLLKIIYNLIMRIVANSENLYAGRPSSYGEVKINDISRMSNEVINPTG